MGAGRSDDRRRAVRTASMTLDQTTAIAMLHRRLGFGATASSALIDSGFGDTSTFVSNDLVSTAFAR